MSDVHVEIGIIGCEGISGVLACRRTGVTEAVQMLRDRELISAQRGEVTVLNRKGLENTAGKFYGTPEAEYRRLLNRIVLFRTKKFLEARCRVPHSYFARGDDHKSAPMTYDHFYAQFVIVIVIVAKRIRLAECGHEAFRWAQGERRHPHRVGPRGRKTRKIK
jgi:hypothetical protein